MGLLDDAIREHLDLKRRHGADPDELARLEHEALGSARGSGEFAPASETDQPAASREAEAPEAAAPFDVERASEPAGQEAAAAETAEHEPVAAEPAERESVAAEPAEREPAAAEAAAEEAETGEQAGAPGYDADPWLEEEGDEVPAEDSLDRPVPAAEEGEDVLEETPEFLQETPEHDRLWFEQRPPRDFDWDK